MRINAGDLFKTRDCQFWSCTEDAEQGDLCAGHAFYVKRQVRITQEDLDQDRCKAFVKPRGVLEGQVRCSYPSKGESGFCGRHDPANMDPRKVHAHISTPRKTRVREAKLQLEISGFCLVEMSRDIDARSVIYEAARQAGLILTTVKLSTGHIQASVVGMDQRGGTCEGRTGRVQVA